MIRFARSLPELRRATREHLKQSGPTRERVLACAVRLLDRGFFRIGTEEYTKKNDTYGLATMLKRHVKLAPGPLLIFDFLSKSGKRRVQSIVDPEVAVVVEQLKRRRAGEAARIQEWAQVARREIWRYQRLHW